METLDKSTCVEGEKNFTCVFESHCLIILRLIFSCFAMLSNDLVNQQLGLKIKTANLYSKLFQVIKLELSF